MKRPRSMTITCFFYWFNTLYLGVVGIISLLLLFGPFLNGIISLNEIFKNVTPLEYFFLGLPILGIGMAIFLAITSWGLWKLKSWARVAAIIGSGLLVIFGLLIIVVKFVQGELGIPYLFILHGLVLWVLFQNDVKVVFGTLSLEGDRASTN